MPHAVTQSCVGDGSCVYACPVNCIQPTPDDPAFDLAEMLFIDPATCVDCGACVSACPVDAIKPHHELEAGEKAFLQLNAAYHQVPRNRPTLAPVRPRLRVRDFGIPLDVAIVGSGPAAMYAAEELLTIPGARVTVYERLERPNGLVRSGVAPDHRRTRRVSGQLERIRRHPRLAMRLGVEIGADLTHDDLLVQHHAVIYAVGASTDRRLEIPGAELPGVASATSFVGWYNGHPDHAGHAFDLSQRRVAVIGNGNVALDVARMLTVDPETLVDSEIAPPALAALRSSAVEEVSIIGRRGAEFSSFTLPELIGLTTTSNLNVVVDPAELPMDAAADDAKLALLRSLPSEPGPTGRTIRLRYGLAPQRILGADRAEGLELAATDDGGSTTIEAGLVLTAIGYRGLPVPALPYDASRGTVPNDAGRVTGDDGAPMPGTYVAGWIKRGPTGFIGTNKRCAQDTVAELVEDHNAGRLSTARAAVT
ncbi:MAG: FAD-dependent oxidoreductase [Solirubrobacteraceae bacterium]|nr:FAD-dependent oxidoreductase [Solirubrobacteraceae bacterium]